MVPDAGPPREGTALCPHTRQWATHTVRALPPTPTHPCARAGITTFSPPRARGFAGRSPDPLSHHFLSPLPTPRPPPRVPRLGILPIRHRHSSLEHWSGLSTSSGSTRVPLVGGAQEAQLDDTGPPNITFTNTEKPDSRVSCFTARSSLLCGSVTRPRHFQGYHCSLRFPDTHRWRHL